MIEIEVGQVYRRTESYVQIILITKHFVHYSIKWDTPKKGYATKSCAVLSNFKLGIETNRTVLVKSSTKLTLRRYLA